MNKTLREGIILIALFGSALFLIMQINWMQVLQIKSATKTTEETLGELIWESIKRDNDEIDIKSVNLIVDSIISKICVANGIDDEGIKWHVVENNQVNAFALPDGHLVLYSGLILSASNAEQLTGVICHEIAHIQHDHVMQKLMKEIGFSVLLSMTTGNGGGEIIGGAVKTLSSSAFDRDNEKEADLSAVDYMQAAEIDCEPFAEFMFQLSRETSEVSHYLAWINSHPDSDDRAKYIVEHAKLMDAKRGKAVSDSTWNKGKMALETWMNY
jgi:predicted Zn-dependent protease